MNDVQHDVGTGATPPRTSSLDIALALAAIGLPVFPCNALKRPAIPRARGGNGFHDASTDPRRIREMWRLAGNSAVMVGVPTGSASGFDALDIDPRHGGHLWEAEHHDQLGETRIHGTMSGGRHWLFVQVKGVHNIQDGETIAAGVDVRGTGGYVIMPPSPGYAVIHEAAIAPWPAWLLALVLKAAEPATNGASNHTGLLAAAPAAISDKRIAGQIAALLDNVRRARDGAKHYTLRSNGLALGGYLHLAGWTEAQAVEQLVEALPPTVKDRKLAQRTAAWAVAEGKKRPLILPDRPRFEGRRRA